MSLVTPTCVGRENCQALEKSKSVGASHIDGSGAIRGTLTDHDGHNGDANNRDYGKVDVARPPGFVQLTASDDTARAQRLGARSSLISRDLMR